MMQLLAQPAGAASSILSLAFSLIMHLIMLATIIISFIALVRITILQGRFDIYQGRASSSAAISDRSIEILLRSAAFAAGVLIIFGSRAAGLAIPDLLAQGLGLTAPVRFVIAGVAVPGALGVLVALYLTATLRKRDSRSLRVMIFIGTLTLAVFVDVYSAAVSTSGFELTRAYVPNITFIVALAIYAFTRIDVHPSPDVPP